MRDNDLINALHRGFIDVETPIEETVRTKFLTNNREEKVTVLESISSELNRCNSFTFSVAFITESGLNELKTYLLDLHEMGIKGRIITSNYLSFNSPKIYRSLLELKNVEVRISEEEGFHSKGYLFDFDNYKTLIMGSSNLTSSALKINHEWNIKISSTYNGEIINKVEDTINDVWDKSIPLTEEWVDTYEIIFKDPNYKNEFVIAEDFDVIKPNKMQLAALKGIEEVRDQNESKALLVSATGTGKTYLSAFDVQKVNPERFLFIVHREQILDDAINSFQNVIGNSIHDYGKLTGKSKEYNKKYVFATIQSLSSDDNLRMFNTDDFDYIVIDEVHKSGAPSYKKVMDYFTPKFLLGMTATPDRPDGINIYELFDYNIAYEIRLQDAIEEDMISPFHYFGVTDYEKDGVVIDDTSDISNLISEERVHHLIEKLTYYGHYGNEVRGLIFVSKVEEAIEISNQLNIEGYRTVSLTGADSIETRYAEIDRLENGELDYIVTVEIFNEGIDIPSINQIVMMRKTESSIIFIQQMGRGLRKHFSKEFVTIIDYIGNYKTNYFIPMALSGDRSLNEDIVREKIIDTSYISGISSVNFEKIAKERIFNSISTGGMSYMNNIKKEYVRIKNKLNRIPMLSDLYINESVDPEIIAAKTKSHYNFVNKYDKEMKNEMKEIQSEDAIKMLEMLSRELVNGKRLHEVILLEYLIENEEINYTQLAELYKSKNVYYTKKTIRSVLSILNMTFYISSTRSKYPSEGLILIENDRLRLNENIKSYLNNETFKLFFDDIIETVKLKSKEFEMKENLTIGKIYSKKDVSRLIELESDHSNTLYGYTIKENTCPLFITYHKSNVSDSIDYDDGFINNKTLKWYTRPDQKSDRGEAYKIINSIDLNIDLLLFVKKDDATHEKNFFYLGKVKPLEGQFADEKMKDGSPVVRINMELETPLTDHMHNFLSTKTEV